MRIGVLKCSRFQQEYMSEAKELTMRFAPIFSLMAGMFGSIAYLRQNFAVINPACRRFGTLLLYAWNVLNVPWDPSGFQNYNNIFNHGKLSSRT